MLQRQGCLSTAPRKYSHRIVLGRDQRPVTPVLNNTMCGFADTALAEPLSADLQNRGETDKRQKCLTSDLQLARFDHLWNVQLVHLGVLYPCVCRRN